MVWIKKATYSQLTFPLFRSITGIRLLALMDSWCIKHNPYSNFHFTNTGAVLQRSTESNSMVWDNMHIDDVQLSGTPSLQLSDQVIRIAPLSLRKNY